MEPLTVPLTDDEREAVRLYYEDGHDLRTISTLTGLSTKAIRAATDRVAVLIAGPAPKREAAPQQEEVPKANEPSTKQHLAAPRIRVVRPVRLPGAHTPPGPLLPVHEPVPPTEVRAAAAPAPVVDAAPPPPADGPGSAAWEALATSPMVRAWAIVDGWHIRPDAERVPGAVVLAYRNAHPGKTQ